jgi:hypothetical protein
MNYAYQLVVPVFVLWVQNTQPQRLHPPMTALILSISPVCLMRLPPSQLSSRWSAGLEVVLYVSRQRPLNSPTVAW